MVDGATWVDLAVKVAAPTRTEETDRRRKAARRSLGQAVKTLVHELGHALLHGQGVQPSREIAEVEVESVAFIVCDALGLDSGGYSFAYVARWSDGDLDLIRTTADRVITCAKMILTNLEVPAADLEEEHVG